MSDKPPIQKPPVRVPGGPSVPHPPQPTYSPPVYQPVPVYVPVPPPYEPPSGAPMTSFLATLGWVSVIWAASMVALGFLLRFSAMDSLGESLASVSKWLSIVLIPLGMIGGLFALFELGRPVADDAPKPTFLRLLLAGVMLCGGIGGQFWFSSYLTSSAAAHLVARLKGKWERIAPIVNNQGGQWEGHAMKEMDTKSWTDQDGEADPSSSVDLVIEFTEGGSVILERPGAPTTTSIGYEATSANTFRRLGPTYEDIQVEFLPNGQMLLKLKDWFRQSELLGRYRRFGDPDLGPEIDPEIAGPWAESLTKLRTELTTQETKRQKLSKLVGDLEVEKRKLATQLQGYGVYKASDLQGKGQAAREVSKELVDLGRQIEIARRKLDDSEGMVAKIKSTLRQISRRVRIAKAEMSEDEIVQARVLLQDLSEQLGDKSSAAQEVNAIDEKEILEKVLQEHGGSAK